MARKSDVSWLRYFVLLALIRVKYWRVGFKPPEIMNALETVERLCGSGLSVARFGDGEFHLIDGGKAWFQASDKVLGERLKEVLDSESEDLLIGIPDVYSARARKSLIFKSRMFWLNLLFYRKSALEIKNNKTYCDALATRFYYCYKSKNNVETMLAGFKRLWHDRDVVTIEGKDNRLGIGHDLFDNMRSIKRIVCPAKNAFAKYEEILSAARQQQRNSLVLISLGPTATVLAYDLAKEGFQAIDIGQIDYEYRGYLQGVPEKGRLKRKQVLELGEDSERLYFSQIIADLSVE